MTVSLRLAFAAVVLGTSTAALWACSSDETTIDGTPDSGTPDGSGNAEASVDSGGGVDAGADVELPPTGCAILDQHDSGRLPDLAPKACNDCVASKCCTQMGACYGGAAADGGVDGGGGGVKTQCMLFGECTDICYATDGGGDPINVCELKCANHYGTAAETAWGEQGECIFNNCANFCP
jgi:hypothetical protein